MILENIRKLIRWGHITGNITEQKFGSATDYAYFTANGNVVFVGKARTTLHLNLEPERFKFKSVKYPAVGFEGIFQTLDYDDAAEEEAFAEDHVSFRWDDTTDIEIVIDWLHDNTDNGVVVWGVEYSSIKAGEVVNGVSTTVTQPSAGNHPAGILQTTYFTDKILHENLEYDDVIAVRLFRDATNVLDTLAEDGRAVEAHFHFVRNVLGEPT